MPRPKTATTQKTCSVILPEALLALVQEAALREDRTVSAKIRLIVTEWAKRQRQEQQTA